MPIRTIDGRLIIDAKHSLPLTITKADIKNADTKDPANCAAALACRRQHHVAEVRIHLGRTYVRQNKGNWLRYETPENLRSEIIAFDRGGTFEPGEYVFRTMRPSHLKARGNRHGSAKVKKPGAKVKSRRAPVMAGLAFLVPAKIEENENEQSRMGISIHGQQVVGCCNHEMYTP